MQPSGVDSRCARVHLHQKCGDLRVVVQFAKDTFGLVRRDTDDAAEERVDQSPRATNASSLTLLRHEVDEDRLERSSETLHRCEVLGVAAHLQVL